VFRELTKEMLARHRVPKSFEVWCDEQNIIPDESINLRRRYRKYYIDIKTVNDVDAMYLSLPSFIMTNCSDDKCKDNSTSCGCSLLLFKILLSLDKFNVFVKVWQTENSGELWKGKYDHTFLCRKLYEAHILSDKNIMKLFNNAHIVEHVDNKGRVYLAPSTYSESCMLWSCHILLGIISSHLWLVPPGRDG
jgi:hypothetical protein